MFKINSKPRFWWPVDVKNPDPEKPGEFVVSTFQAEFVILPEDEHRKLQDEINQTSARANQVDYDIYYIKRILKGWRDIVGEDDQPFAFNDDALDFVLQHVHVRQALFEAYSAAARGQAYKRAD